MRSKHIIRTEEEDSRRRKLRSKRKSIRNVCKVFLCMTSLGTCVTIAVLGFVMKNELFNFDETAALPVNNDQNIDEAQFESFGLYNEPAWRMFLLASLTLTFLFTLYMPIGIVFEHYHTLMVYNGAVFAMSVLTSGSQYFAVPYLAASIILLLHASIIHIYNHILRLDRIEENRFWSLLRLQHQQDDIRERERLFGNRSKHRS